MNVTIALDPEYAGDDGVVITHVRDVRIDSGALWIREEGSSLREGRETIFADGVWKEARINH